MRDGDAVAATIAEEKPDVLIHMAFVMDPTHDEPEMYEANVNGTFNVLRAAKEGQAGRVVYATGSSPDAARLAGINPRIVVFAVFVLTGALTGFAAVDFATILSCSSRNCRLRSRQ